MIINYWSSRKNFVSHGERHKEAWDPKGEATKLVGNQNGGPNLLKATFAAGSFFSFWPSLGETENFERRETRDLRIEREQNWKHASSMDNFSFKCDGNKNRALFDRFWMISCVTVHSMHLVKN